MSSPDWMPLNVGDYLGDTIHLEAHEHGAYLLLIMRYWKDGGLTADERMIQRYSKLSDEQWAQSRDVLAAFFGEGWSHHRIDEELAKAAEIITKRRAAAEQRHSKSDAHAVHMDSNSSDTGVPPITKNQEPEKQTPRASAEVRESLDRDFQENLWTQFPRHENSRRAPALKAFVNLGHDDRVACIRGAARYAIRFEDDRSDKRPMPERLRFVPHLVTWIHQRGWETELETV